MASAGQIAWQLAFQISPIILRNGLSSFMPGGMLPLIAITEAINYPLGVLSGGSGIDLNRTFANFEPMPSSTLLSNGIGRFPLANQAVAANSIIAEPLRVGMRMIALAQEDFGYYEKLAVMTALQVALQQHANQGGTYIVATPSKIYVDCILKEIRDISTPATKQPQNMWEFDFEQPLLTVNDVQASLNSLFSRLTAGLQPAFSNLGSTIGQGVSLATQAVSPIAANSAASIAGGITVTPLPPLPGFSGLSPAS